ncbi:hypothetical protein LTR53_001127 [Teratosphaeriaceae sp. CCFEE 6253]|nr:hypothetical protein LTR53_001127 [Teratosphaeriaceae sp. CCFEE 6253]
MSVRPLGIFSLRDKASHSQRRSLLSHAFSQQNIVDCMPLISQKVEHLLDAFSQDASTTADVFLRFRLFALDVVGELFLGTSFGALKAGTSPQFLHDVDRHFLLSNVEWNFPWLAALLSWMPIPSIREFVGASERIAQFGHGALQGYIQRYGRDSRRKDLLTKILISKDKDADKAVMTDRETYVEIANLVFAGTDTTSTTLTYMFWSLARFPEWQDRIRSEIDEKLGTGATYEQQAVAKMPVVEAVINEALRLYPAAPASLPRIAPQGGWSWNSYNIPAKTIVSMQCYTTQRTSAAFIDPESFSPTRWLDAEPTTDMKTLFMPFSKGTRACLGKGLAMLELKTVLIALMSRYVVRVPTQTTEDSMSMRDHFLMMPKSGKCELIFEPLPQKT